MFFPIYESLKDYSRKKNFTRNQSYLFSTVIAGGLCNFLTNPIWIVRTRIMVQALHPTDHHYNTDSLIKSTAQMDR